MGIMLDKITNPTIHNAREAMQGTTPPCCFLSFSLIVFTELYSTGLSTTVVPEMISQGTAEWGLYEDILCSFSINLKLLPNEVSFQTKATNLS